MKSLLNFRDNQGLRSIDQDNLTNKTDLTTNNTNPTLHSNLTRIQM